MYCLYISNLNCWERHFSYPCALPSVSPSVLLTTLRAGTMPCHVPSLTEPGTAWAQTLRAGFPAKRRYLCGGGTLQRPSGGPGRMAAVRMYPLGTQSPSVTKTSKDRPAAWKIPALHTLAPHVPRLNRASSRKEMERHDGLT